MPNGIGRSFPVSTAFTPGTPAARDVSIERTRAWGWGLRSSFAKSIRGKKRSSANRVTPVTFAVASTLRWALPTTRKPAALLPDTIQGLRCRLRVLPAHASRRQLDRFVNLDIAGTAAEVARQCLLDVVSGGSGVGGEQRFGGEEKGRGTVAALGGAQLRKRLLQGLQPAARGHAFHRLHAAAYAGQANH